MDDVNNRSEKSKIILPEIVMHSNKIFKREKSLNTATKVLKVGIKSEKENKTAHYKFKNNSDISVTDIIKENDDSIGFLQKLNDNIDQILNIQEKEGNTIVNKKKNRNLFNEDKLESLNKPPKHAPWAQEYAIIDNISKTKFYKCPYCSITIKNKYHFLEHYRKHSGEKPFCCDLCGKTYAQKSVLTRHVEEYHKKIKNVTCEVCQFKFYSKESLNVHMNSHTDNRPFVCEACGKAFRQYGALYKHKMGHANVFPYACDLCSKKYRQSKSLKIHYRLHTGERPFECSICRKKFADKCILTDHIKTHDKSKDYFCDICGRKFKVERSLKNHIRIHRKKSNSLTAGGIDLFMTS